MHVRKERGMRRDHWLLLAAFFVTFGLQLEGIKTGWPEVISPQFIGGSLLQLGILLRALWTPKVGA